VAFLTAPHAAAAACPQHFFGGATPAISNPKLAPKTRQLCYTEFAILHSGLTRTPLWVAEHLNPKRAQGARELNRVDNFHADPNLLPDERAELSDYVRSGFDRGHMAPAGDMTTPQGMDESFSLANMVPQNSDNNRNLWESIERVVRDYSERHEVYVVTGPLFQGENLQALKGRVLVPTHIAKAVFDPTLNAGAAYLAPNQEGDEYRIISLAELQQLSGIDPFPQLPPDIKQTILNLPPPQLRRSKGPGRNTRRPPPQADVQQQPSAPSQEGFVGGILEAIDQFGRSR
jgi:endonuclease G